MYWIIPASVSVQNKMPFPWFERLACAVKLASSKIVAGDGGFWITICAGRPSINNK